MSAGNMNGHFVHARKDAQKPCAVYVIGREGGSNFSKIGISDNPESRLKSLQSGSPHKLYLAFQLHMKSRTAASMVEVLAHDMIDALRLNSEWFAISPYGAEVVTRVADKFLSTPPCPTRKSIIMKMLGRVVPEV